MRHSLHNRSAFLLATALVVGLPIHAFLISHPSIGPREKSRTLLSRISPDWRNSSLVPFGLEGSHFYVYESYEGDYRYTSELANPLKPFNGKRRIGSGHFEARRDGYGLLYRWFNRDLINLQMFTYTPDFTHTDLESLINNTPDGQNRWVDMAKKYGIPIPVNDGKEVSELIAFGLRPNGWDFSAIALFGDLAWLCAIASMIDSLLHRKRWPSRVKNFDDADEKASIDGGKRA